jgi:hypothetical protein
MRGSLDIYCEEGLEGASIRLCKSFISCFKERLSFLRWVTSSLNLLTIPTRDSINCMVDRPCRRTASSYVLTVAIVEGKTSLVGEGLLVASSLDEE